MAIEKIPAEIEYQSLNIDSVSGATLPPPFGILSAVTDCVEQAYGDVKALYIPGRSEEGRDRRARGRPRRRWLARA